MPANRLSKIQQDLLRTMQWRAAQGARWSAAHEMHADSRTLTSLLNRRLVQRRDRAGSHALVSEGDHYEWSLTEA